MYLHTLTFIISSSLSKEVAGAPENLENEIYFASIMIWIIRNHTQFILVFSLIALLFTVPLLKQINFRNRNYENLVDEPDAADESNENEENS